MKNTVSLAVARCAAGALPKKCTSRPVAVCARARSATCSAARASAQAQQGHRHVRLQTAGTAARLSHGLAGGVRRLRKLPLPAGLAHNEVQEVLRLALGRPAAQAARISAA